MYYRNGLFGVFHREIEYLRDVFLALLGRGVALREFGFALYECFGESVATRVAATAAVRAGKVTANVVYAGVVFHRHFRA